MTKRACLALVQKYNIIRISTLQALPPLPLRITFEKLIGPDRVCVVSTVVGQLGFSRSMDEAMHGGTCRG